MKREIMAGNYCRKCESVMSLHRLDCSCMRDMPSYATKIWREKNWKPLYWKAEISMESANHG
jgi:hypothetical protein